MNKIFTAAVLMAITCLSLNSSAQAQSPNTPANVVGNVTVIPGSDAITVTNWYKQNIFDTAGNKIGEVEDVLVSADGKISALLVGVGGFLSIGEKVVAISFPSVKSTLRDGKMLLTMSASKDALKAAPGYSYDRATMTWKPA
jgi:sporulation protein YlmC with PRC-barrel domain